MTKLKYCIRWRMCAEKGKRPVASATVDIYAFQSADKHSPMGTLSTLKKGMLFMCLDKNIGMTSMISGRSVTFRPRHLEVGCVTSV